MPDLGKRPYWLHCRFEIGAQPTRRQLEQATHKWADRFIEDMAKKGYQYVEKFGIEVTFKGAHIAVMNLPRHPRVLSAKEMLPQVMQGARFRATDEPRVMVVPHFTETELWDYDIKACFLHDTILMDKPDRHEERIPG